MFTVISFLIPSKKRNATFYWDCIENSFLFLWWRERIYKIQRLSSFEEAKRSLLMTEMPWWKDRTYTGLMILLTRKLDFYSNNWFIFWWLTYPLPIWGYLCYIMLYSVIEVSSTRIKFKTLSKSYIYIYIYTCIIYIYIYIYIYMHYIYIYIYRK